MAEPDFIINSENLAESIERETRRLLDYSETIDGFIMGDPDTYNEELVDRLRIINAAGQFRVIMANTEEVIRRHSAAEQN